MSDVVFQIDVLEVSQAMLRGTRTLDTLTRGELVAVLGFVLQENGESHNLQIDFPEAFALIGKPIRTDMPAGVENAIAEVLEARRRLSDLRPHGTTIQAMRLRGELFAAIDALGNLFDEEKAQ